MGDRAVREFLPGDGRHEWFADMVGGPDMVVVPVGSCVMRHYSSGQTIRHRVRFSAPFAIGRYTITVKQFEAFVDATGYEARDERGAYLLDRGGGEPYVNEPPGPWTAEASWRKPGFSQDGNHPVTCVNWHDAKAYTTWLSEVTSQTYRLPSEAEWEYCCRAGTTTDYWWGDDDPRMHANFNRNAFDKGPLDAPRERTIAVDRFGPNPWGLYNMCGNVSEWCEDIWHETYIDAPTDGSAWITGDDGRRVQRGASWDTYSPDALASHYRGVGAPEHRINSYGIRVVRELMTP